MASVFHLRLALDLVAAVLLVFGLSYWWLGNVAHELAGTAMFALLVAHNVFNRRFYARLRDKRQGARSRIDIVLTVALLVVMAALLVTSVLISHALSGWLSRFSSFTVRQIHTSAGYWALVIVAIHLGLRWPKIMAYARSLFGLSTPNAARTWSLRLVALVIALHGIWSASQLGLGGKLAMRSRSTGGTSRPTPSDSSFT